MDRILCCFWDYVKNNRFPRFPEQAIDTKRNGLFAHLYASE